MLINKRFICLFIVLLIIVSFQNADGQSWDTLGNRGFSAGEADYVSIAMDSSGTPYVVYSDFAHFMDATVMKFDSGSWVTVGIAGFSITDSGGANFTSIAIAPGGTPYVAYADLGDTQKASVMKFNGTDWVQVGNRGFSAGNVGYVDIAIDTGGTPYVVYQDDSFPCCDGSPTSVKKFDGTNWVYVGNARFTEAGAMSRIAIDKHGTIYVAYEDYIINKTGVMRFDGTNWSALDPTGWPAPSADEVSQNMSLALDTSGAPYVAFSDATHGNKATVMKYADSAWVSVGMPGITDTEADFVCIAIDNNNTPYIAFELASAHIATYVMKYNGSNWEFVDSPVSATLELYPGLAIDPSGAPYVCYQDFHVGQKATVMKYETPTGFKKVNNNPVSSLIAFPNPCNGSFTLNINSPKQEDATILVSNVLGEKVNELKIMTNHDTNVTLNNQHGIYFISAITKDGTMNTKIVVE